MKYAYGVVVIICLASCALSLRGIEDRLIYVQSALRAIVFMAEITQIEGSDPPPKKTVTIIR